MFTNLFFLLIMILVLYSTKIIMKEENENGPIFRHILK